MRTGDELDSTRLLQMRIIQVTCIIFCAVCFFIAYYNVGACGLSVSTGALLSNFLRKSHYKVECPNSSDFSERALTLERRLHCNPDGKKACYSTSKSLVLTFWSEKSKQKWTAQNILSAFPSDSFDHVVFLHDNSTWHSHPGFADFIWIRAQGQIRLWFISRFLSPSILNSYKYIWTIDDDVLLDFIPLQYQCVIDQLHIPLSAPGRSGGVMSHKITQVNPSYIEYVGRWTDFVETGPVFVATSSTWMCIYEHLDTSSGSGWGLDLIWCHMLAEACLIALDATRVCAIIDAYRIEHQSVAINSYNYGKAELFSYTRKYTNWVAKRQNYGPLATNRSVIEVCSTPYLTSVNN
jgi:hypothetical protein